MVPENQQTSCHACEGQCTGMCWKRKAMVGALLLAVSGSLFLLALFASTLKEYQFIGRNMPGEVTQISVDGEGEAFGVPDVAEFSFTVSQESKTAKEARKVVDDKVRDILAYLKESGIKENDIKSTSYSLNPNYDWIETKIMCVAYPCPQPPGKQVLRGYEVSQSLSVKVRDLDKVGDVIGGVTDKGASNLSGPTFTVDNEDGLLEKARKEAIGKAKAKAEKLADELGVTLVRIVSYNEGGNYPIYNYARGGVEMKAMAMSEDVASLPASIPVGENRYTSNVTIVYEVR